MDDLVIDRFLFMGNSISGHPLYSAKAKRTPKFAYVSIAKVLPEPFAVYLLPKGSQLRLYIH